MIKAQRNSGGREPRGQKRGSRARPRGSAVEMKRGCSVIGSIIQCCQYRPMVPRHHGRFLSSCQHADKSACKPPSTKASYGPGYMPPNKRDIAHSLRAQLSGTRLRVRGKTAPLCDMADNPGSDTHAVVGASFLSHGAIHRARSWDSTCRGLANTAPFLGSRL